MKFWLLKCALQLSFRAYYDIDVRTNIFVLFVTSLKIIIPKWKVAQWYNRLSMHLSGTVMCHSAVLSNSNTCATASHLRVDIILCLHFFFQLKDVLHTNLNVFVGASINPPDHDLVWLYCQKGSLQVRHHGNGSQVNNTYSHDAGFCTQLSRSNSFATGCI